jgi:hypothetical protein
MKPILRKSGVFAIVFLIANLFFVSSSFGQDTGLLAPTTSANINSVTNVANGLTSNNLHAVFDSSGDQGDYGGFSVSIPAGSIILGIEVQLEGNRTSARDLNVQLTWNNKTTFTTNKLMPSFGGTDALRTVGTPTDTWGHTWAVSEFTNANFFVRLTSTGGGGNLNLDQVLLKIYYCTSPTITTIGTAATACFSASSQTTTLLYTATTNSPTSYSIAWTGMANQGSTAFAFNAGGGTITGITIPASTLTGTYNGTLTITNAGGCSSTNPISVVVTGPTAIAGGALSAICQGGTSVALGGSVGGSATGGTWSDGVLGGTFNPNDTDLNATWTPPPGYSGNALLTLTTSGGACGTTTASKSQTVDAQPTAVAGGSQTICANQTATISGTATNGTIVWTVVGGVTTGTLDNPNIQSPVFTPDQFFEGPATLTMTVSNGVCTPDSDTYTVIVNSGTATVDPGANATVCMSTPEQVQLSGIVGGGASSGTWSGGNGQFLPNNTDLATSYTPTQLEIDSGSVILTLTSEDPGGSCPGAVAKSRTITFKKAPTAETGVNQPNSQSICPDASATVSGAVSSNGTILWTHNGSGLLSDANTLTPTYQSVAGEAGSTVTLTLTVSNSPCPDATATYTVVINPLPINRSLAGTANICSGTSTNIQVIDSEYEGNFGMNYQLRNNANNALVGGPVAGTGGTIDLPTGNLISTTTFNVLATNVTTSCFLQMTGTITITVNPAPLNRAITGPAAAICTGSTASITVGTATASVNGTTYQLRNNADNSNIVGSTVTISNTSTASFGLSTLALATTTTFNVLATINATGCSAQMSGTPTVTVNPAISNNIISAAQFICSGATPAILTGVPAGGNGTYTYGWFQSTDNFAVNNTNASTANGSRTEQNYSPPSLTQTMWYRRTVASDACATDTSPAVQITVNPFPTVFTVTGGGAYCAGGPGMPIGLSNSQSNVNYQLLLGGTPDGGPVAGTGSAITFGNKTVAGTYTVVATATYNVTTNCSSNMTGSATITVNPVPVTVGASVCLGESGVLTSSTVCALGTPIDTGSLNINAGLGVNIPVVFNTDWINPDNIVGAGNATATIAFGDDTDYLRGTNYDFSAIPANAEIKGILVRINRTGSSTFGGVSDAALYLVKDVSGLPVIQDTGANRAKTGTAWPTSLTIESYGSATDLWNLSWTVSDIKNANFGVALAAHNNSGSNTRTGSVDYMQITVSYSVNGVLNWYTAPSGGTFIGTGSPFNPVGVLNSGLADTDTPGTTTFYAECTSVPGCRTNTDFVVHPLPTLSCPANSAVCIDTPAYALTTASPSDGTYSGTGVDNNIFNPSTAGVGPHIITYSYTDGNGCSNSCTFTITVNAAVVASGTQVNVLCKDGTNGSIDLSVTGGSGLYTYLWSNGEITEDISGLAASAIPYSVTITETNGCPITGTTSFIITEPAVVTASGTQVDVLCKGASTGSIDLTVTGGSGLYTYLWDDNGATDEDRTGLAAGTYSVTITESNGCAVTGTTSFTIIEPPTALETNITTHTNVDCFGNNTGSATVEAIGGTPPYTYSWNDVGSQTTATATNLAAGEYTVTVTDANGNGCVSTEDITIEEPVEVTVSASVTNPVCSGSAPGTIAISGVSTGASTIIQLDGAGPDLSAQTTFAPGTYVITASAPNWNNDGFCTATASVTITEPIEVTVDADGTNVSCHGFADGTITISGVSAGATTKIQLDGIGVDLSAQDTFGPGTYVITASAPNGNSDGYCTVTTSVTITEPDELTASITAQNNVDCFGGNNGSATVTATGGTTEYTYLWDDALAQTTATATNLIAGIYHVTVTDANGCTDTATANIITDDNELPTVITQDIDVELDPTSVSITVSQINNGSDDNCGIQSITVSPSNFTCADVGSNTVTLTVTDTNGNINTGEATVTVKDLIKPVINGMPADKTVNISGGNCSSLVKWIAPSATDNCGMQSLTSSEGNDPGDPVLLSVGVHPITYTATDVNGNTETASFIITVIDQIVPTITNCPSNVTVNTDNNICGARVFYVQPNVNDCNGASLSINNNAHLSGNIFPVGTTTVIWTATDTSPNHNQSSCSFTVTVEDHQAPVANVASLPTITGECSVTVPTPTASDNCDGTINGTPDGPTTYNTTGTYTIIWTYTDSHGNSSSQTQTVNVNATPPVFNTQPVSLTKCEGQSATFSVSSPAIGYQWQINTGSGWNNLGSETNSTLNIASVTTGMNGNKYRVIVNGLCSSIPSDEVTLTVYSLPIASNQLDQVLCNTSTFIMTQSGSGTWTLINGTATITTASSPITTITGVAAGTSATLRWTVTNGPCSAFDEVTVTNNSCVLFTASIAVSSPDAFCSGLTLTANPSVAGSYSYLWSPGGATTQSTTLYNTATVGIYTVTVTKIGSSDTAQASYNFQPQNSTNTYTILGTNGVNLSESNFVQTGSVGATASNGTVNINKNSTVAGPGAFVKANNITVQPPANVPVRIVAPATVTLPSMQLNTSSTTGLTDLNIPNNTTVTKTGNYKNVTVGNNCNVTFSTGTIFGKVIIGKSSQVKFNANTLNVNSVTMADGTDTAPTKLLFASDVSVRVKDYVQIGKSSMTNTTGGYNAVFYINGSNVIDNVFHVKPGGNVTVKASVYAPNGTIKVEGNVGKNIYMKGFYIAKNIVSLDKNIYWNQFDCLNPTAKTTDVENIVSKEVQPLVSPEVIPFDVKAYPNPSNYQFTLEVKGGNVEKIEVEVYDMGGRHIKHIESDFNQSIVFGEELPAGTYLTIVSQGSNRKALKLIKK